MVVTTMRRPTTLRHAALLLAAAVLLTACSAAPRDSYFPPPTSPATAKISHAIHRAAVAAGDDPDRYSFAFVKTRAPVAVSDEEATVYVSDGLAALPVPVVEAVMAHEVAHEVLGHIGTRRALSLSITAGFTVLGLFAPGASLIDFVVNPIAVRAFSRRQELEADQKAVEILRAMGYPAPRRMLSDALRTVGAVGPKVKEDAGGMLSWHPAPEERLVALEPLEPPTTAAPFAVTKP